MFVQVIQGRTSQPGALAMAGDQWVAELAPGATGWLGSTGGATDDGRAILIARFESEAAARANNDRPEQGAWWAEASKVFDGEVSFLNSTDVMEDFNGDPNQSGFVQIMQGRSSNPARAKELMNQDPEMWAAYRPEVIGALTIGHDDGAYTSVLYFTSEAAAREGERREPPAELAAAMTEMGNLAVGETEFFDLRQPKLYSPA